jgi:hypothetical protein
MYFSSPANLSYRQCQLQHPESQLADYAQDGRDDISAGTVVMAAIESVPLVASSKTVRQAVKAAASPARRAAVKAVGFDPLPFLP